jgi:hypothetical protein
VLNLEKIIQIGSYHPPEHALKRKPPGRCLAHAIVPRFFTQQAIVFNNAAGAPSPGTNPVTVAVVSLHIAHKAQGQTILEWPTFEQVDNDTKSFYNPNCTPAGSTSCTPSAPTAIATPIELSPTGKPLSAPVQVVSHLQPTNPGLNSSVQGMLAGTPFQYYQLIGTQWSTGAIGAAPQVLGAYCWRSCSF